MATSGHAWNVLHHEVLRLDFTDEICKFITKLIAVIGYVTLANGAETLTRRAAKNHVNLAGIPIFRWVTMAQKSLKCRPA